MRLNPAQHAAVQHSEGPLLVLAGAGSGKTRVITSRIARLIGEGIDPKSILAVSFTNKAANELRERMAHIIGKTIADDLWLSTFHSFGVRFLRIEGKRLGFDGKFVILDQSDSLGLVRELMREHADCDRSLDAMAVHSRISLWKNAFLSPTQIAIKPDEYTEAAAAVYEPYEQRLRSMHAVDFDDLVVVPVRLLSEDDSLRDKWRRRFRHVMVDEFQDTNKAQLNLTKLLTNESGNVCVVGDDDQSIYGWRGADVSNILNFEKHFSNATVIKLEDNYRSIAQIITVANAAIANGINKGHQKTLRSARGEGKDVRVAVKHDTAKQAEFVAQEIRNLRNEGYNERDIAVLYRSNTQARILEEELRAAGVAYRVYGGAQVFDRKEIKDAIAYLRLLSNPRDDLSLRRAINFPPRGIGKTSLGKMETYAKANNMSLLQSLRRAPLIPLTDRAAKGAENLIAAFDLANKVVRSQGLASAANALFERAGVLSGIASLPEKEARRRQDNLSFLLRSIDRYEQSERQDKPTFHQFLNRLALGEDAPEQKNEVAKVTLSSLHSSKGLEFPVVFLIGCVEGVMPHSRTTDPKVTDASPTDVEEERRLFYVGVTRAKDLLYICRPKERTHRGRVVPLTPSRFLQGLPEDAMRPYEGKGQKQLGADEISKMAEALLNKLQAS